MPNTTRMSPVDELTRHYSAPLLDEMTLVPDAKSRRPATATVEMVVRRVVKSRLLSLKQVRALWNSLPSDRKPEKGAELGQEFVKQKLLTPFQMAAVLEGKERSLILGKYIVLDRLGQGGAGTVVKARHAALNRVVALKLLSLNHAPNSTSVQRFKREMIVGARLDHPNVVTVYDADEANGEPFLVMQHVDGRDLGTLVREQGPLPMATALDYVLQAARGLERAHDQGIIHRDIKPSNLLLDRWRIVKVVDFGLARIANVREVDHQGADLTRTGTIMGTADYMSPEQALCTKDADHRADIYSLGAVLFFLLTGQPLYHGNTVMEKLIAHRDAPVPSLQPARPETDQALEAIFRSMVEKQVAQRCQSMKSVIAALENYLSWMRRATQEPAAPPLPVPDPTSFREEPLSDFFQTLGSTAEADVTMNLQPGSFEQFAIAINPNAAPVPSSGKRVRPVSRFHRQATPGRPSGRPNGLVWSLVRSIRTWSP